jgi:phage FluMu protein gp41
MTSPTIGISSAPDTALARIAAHLQAAFWHAHASAGDDLLSPWADTAHTIDIAAGAVQLHLSGPVEPARHPDCLSALLAAEQELTHLPPRPVVAAGALRDGPDPSDRGTARGPGVADVTGPVSAQQLLTLAEGQLRQLAVNTHARPEQLAAAWPAFLPAGQHLLARIAAQPGEHSVESAATDDEHEQPTAAADPQLERAATLLAAAGDLIVGRDRSELSTEQRALDAAHATVPCWPAPAWSPPRPCRIPSCSP